MRQAKPQKEKNASTPPPTSKDRHLRSFSPRSNGVKNAASVSTPANSVERSSSIDASQPKLEHQEYTSVDFGVLLREQNSLIQSLVEQNRQILEQNRSILNMLSDRERKSDIETPVARSTSSTLPSIPLSPVQVTSSNPRVSPALTIESAIGFSATKFLTTLETVRQTQVPPSHALCFFYAPASLAERAALTHTVGATPDLGGIPLSLRGPDEPPPPDKDWSDGYFRGEVAIAMAVPRRLLWPVPTWPGQSPSFTASCNGSHRVLPTALVAALTGDGGAISISRSAKRAYYLPPDQAGAGSSVQAPASASVLAQNASPAESSSGRAQQVIRPQNWNEFAQAIDRVRSECVASGSHLLLYHFTNPQFAEPILRNGLRMSTQGQGDGGVYFSTRGPSDYGFGVSEGAEYEQRLVTDLFGAERVPEYRGRHALDLCLVCSVHEGLLAPAPGGRDNALMVPKELFETVASPSADGAYYLSPACLRLALLIEPDFSFRDLGASSSFGSLDVIAAGAAAESNANTQTAKRAALVALKLRDLAGSNALATLPSTVPALPQGFQPQALDRLKSELLPSKDKDDSSSTSSSSNNRICVLIGMGGMGKSTMASSLVMDLEIRAAYDKIAWASFGQSPNVHVLQDSIHFQLRGEAIPATAPNLANDLVLEHRIQALRIASRGLRVLLVLDDIWESSFVEPFNFLDPSSASRMLVTSRIRGLFSSKSSIEIPMNELSTDAALSLLMSTAAIDELAEGSQERELALKIVNMAGRLPLTVSIAGKLISANGSEITKELVAVMQEDGLRAEMSLDGGKDQGPSFEESIISASLAFFKGRERRLILSTFFAFAIFPEDTCVPPAVFEALAASLLDCSLSEATQEIDLRRWISPLRLPGDKATRRASTASVVIESNRAVLMVRRCLNELLRLNLCSGSMSTGFQMHDIVREYVLTRFEEDALVSSHQCVLNTLLVARQLISSDSASVASLANATSKDDEDSSLGKVIASYLQRNLSYHIRAAISSLHDPTSTTFVRLLNNDCPTVQLNLAFAVGVEEIKRKSKALEEQGDLLSAARVMFLMTYLVGRADMKDCSKIAVRKEEVEDAYFYARDLLIRVDSPETSDFEWRVLCRGLMVKAASADSEKTLERLQVVIQRSNDAGKELEGNKGIIEALLHWTYSKKKCPDVPKVLTYLKEARHVILRVAPSLPNPNLVSYFTHIFPATAYGLHTMTCSHLDQWQSGIGSEKDLLVGIESYENKNCSLSYYGDGQNRFLEGYFIPIAGYHLGSKAILKAWIVKAHAEFEEVNSNTAVLFSSYFFEILGCFIASFQTLLDFGESLSVISFFQAFGLKTFQDIDSMFSLYWGSDANPLIGDGSRLKLYLKFVYFLALAENGQIEDAAWIPSPTQIAEADRSVWLLRYFGVASAVGLGTRALFLLKRFDEAVELAMLGLTPEQPFKHNAVVDCYLLLGQVSASRGAKEEAHGHFSAAIERGGPSLAVLSISKIVR